MSYKGTEKSPLLSATAGGSVQGGSETQFEWWERPSDSRTQQIHIDLVESTHVVNKGDDSFSNSSPASPPPNKNATGAASDDHEIGSIDIHSHAHEKKLGEFTSTAICGNDITSSVLYVSGTAASVCGVWAPVATGIVGVVLALFRPIYHEVVTALPMNGGAYNVLLNTTSKKIAGVAAALTILSYVATAVVSAYSAISYLKTGILPTLITDVYLVLGTIVLLAIFMLLNLIGISESAVVAVGMFTVHLGTLVLLIIMSCIDFFSERGLQKFHDAWHMPHSSPIFNQLGRSTGSLIFLGFASAMLGITGFETSANFVEQQEVGVFPKTLRNMWAAVAFFNPVISLLVFGVVDYEQAVNPDNADSLLAIMALGINKDRTWLRYIVSIDGFIVLSGAVLTSYVGVTGLMRRLALDRVLFQFLLAENSMRHTNHWIIIGFFSVATSLILIVRNQASTLSGVYTCAFLCVMTLFAFGNMLLKYKRSKLPREVIASWPTVILATAFVIAGFVGTVIINPIVLIYFLVYFTITMLVIAIMFTRVTLLKLLLFFCKRLFANRPSLQTSIARQIQQVNETKMIFFTKTDSIAALNKAVLYVRDNEQTNWLLIVHVYTHKENIPPRLQSNVQMLDEAYPKMRIDLVLVHADFGPTIVDKLAVRLAVPKNFMFITCPGETFTHKVADLGGVRMVTH